MNKATRILISTMLLLSVSFHLRGQIKEISFGEIPKEDLEMADYAEDPTADAVILENYGTVRLRSLEKIVVNVERHIRIKIINTDGLDYANVEIPYGSNEKVMGIKAASYNTEEGKTVSGEVDKKSIYFEKSSRYRNTVRFSIPNVKAGSVIEYKYSLESPDIFTLYTLEFQHEIPVRRCGFRVEFPGYFEYKFVTGGDLSKVRLNRSEEYVNFGSRTVNGFVGHWTAFNVPAYREEPFSTGSEDYYARIGFELSKIDIPGYYFEEVSPTYPKLSKKLLDRTDFGGYISKGMSLKKKTDELKAQGGSDTDIVRRIYTVVTEHMMWNGYDDYTSSAAMSKIYNDARGNAADINLMLISMLRMAGIAADPLILSTRENGMLDPHFALIQRFNYVVAYVRADGEQYIIDATDPLRPFNTLPFQCLNGQGWVVNTSGGSWIDVRNNEKNSETMRFVLNLSEEGSIKGTASNSYESYDAWAVRKVCKLEGVEAYTDRMRFYNNRWRIDALELENLEELDKPVIETISLTVPDAAETGDGIMYMNPVLFNQDGSNEFYEDERLSPVDFGCPSFEKYSCEITIPEGWTVAELPQSVNIRLDGGGGAYRYDIRSEGRKIILDAEINVTTVAFLPDRYSSLRNFRASIIRKQSEVVILKKEI
ncbi:MAG: DUF3857 domain-containing protein [Bacteroidales bacterium]|nr:DUF3857 domain-containing protein [Bacteroidales bacterium]